MDDKMLRATVGGKIKEIYSITNELEQMFPGRHFTPDGHLVGSIGEVLVASRYGLKLLPSSAKTHDAIDQDGRLIQIKATQTDRVSISSEPDYLLIIKIEENGTYNELYNGRGTYVWQSAGKMQKNGQRSISTMKLKELMKSVPESDKIKPDTNND